MATQMKGTVPYTGKAGSLIFVSCDVTQREATPKEIGRRKIPKKADVCVWYGTTYKSRLLLTDLSNNRSFDREASLNRVLFDFIRRQ